MEKPTCKNCNQIVFDENRNPTHRCVLKGHVDNIDFWCVCYTPRFILNKNESESEVIENVCATSREWLDDIHSYNIHLEVDVNSEQCGWNLNDFK
jgi:hypothetical protein